MLLVEEMQRLVGVCNRVKAIAEECRSIYLADLKKLSIKADSILKNL
jgi:hypothetical protein